jgi:hypothetical protein
LPVACCLLPVACCLLPVSCCLLHVAARWCWRRRTSPQRSTRSRSLGLEQKKVAVARGTRNVARCTQHMACSTPHTARSHGRRFPKQLVVMVLPGLFGV